MLEDFGPVYAFWLFAFERYNGILGNQPNNNRSLEPQLMNRFLRDNFAYSFAFPSEFDEDFNPVCHRDELMVGSVGDTVSDRSGSTIETTSSCRRGTFDDLDLDFVMTLYKKLNPETNIAMVNSIFRKYTSISCRG